MVYAHADASETRNSLWGPILVGGFATALVLWTAWFISHLPWIGLREAIALPLLLVVWAASLAIAGWSIGGPAGAPRDGWKVGLGAGLVSALLGLLVLGSKLTESTAAAHATQTAAILRPNAILIVLGFLATGAVLGCLCGAIGAHMRRCKCSKSPNWLARFAVVCVFTTAPLLFVGGLVTSTNSGMAVPDYPNTYGTNMFLYPLGPRVHISGEEHAQPETWSKFLNTQQIAQAESMEPDARADFISRIATRKIFLEHSHRLFGTLLGLASIVLMVWTFVSRREKGLRVLALAAFLLVLGQGLLGGLRVLQGSVDASRDNRLFAMAHGVLAQLTLAVIVVLAVKLTTAYAAAKPAPAGPTAKRARIFMTAALHSTILQLLFGAMFRHMRSPHALWSHAGFAFVVVGLAVVGALLTMKLVQAERDAARDQPLLNSLSARAKDVLGAVGIQFALGWLAFMFGGDIRTNDPATVAQALIRTVHQANGAAFLAALVAAWVMVRRIAPKRAA